MSRILEFTSENWEKEMEDLFLPEVVDSAIFLILFNFFWGFNAPVYISCNQVAREIGDELKIDGIIYQIECKGGEVLLKDRERSS